MKRAVRAGTYYFRLRAFDILTLSGGGSMLTHSRDHYNRHG